MSATSGGGTWLSREPGPGSRGRKGQFHFYGGVLGDYGSTTVGEFNGHGIPDLAVQNDVSIIVYLGKGDGTFETGPDKLAEKLIAALGQQGTILVYSSFEKTRIRALKTAYPDLAGPLEAILERVPAPSPVARGSRDEIVAAFVRYTTSLGPNASWGRVRAWLPKARLRFSNPPSVARGLGVNCDWRTPSKGWAVPAASPSSVTARGNLYSEAFPSRRVS